MICVWLGGDVRALLRRIDRDRVQGIELGREHPEQGELQTHPPLAQRGFEAAGPQAFGISQSSARLDPLAWIGAATR
jgi:hypothetical protein